MTAIRRNVLRLHLQRPGESNVEITELAGERCMLLTLSPGVGHAISNWSVAIGEGDVDTLRMWLDRFDKEALVALAGATQVGTLSRDDGLPDEIVATRLGEYLALGERIEVTLDGVTIENDCVAANRAAGWADVLVRDASGAFLLDDIREGPAIVRVTGAVAFRRVQPGKGERRGG